VSVTVCEVQGAALICISNDPGNERALDCCSRAHGMRIIHVWVAMLGYSSEMRQEQQEQQPWQGTEAGHR
jgi:hypothetical protein